MSMYRLVWPYYLPHSTLPLSQESPPQRQGAADFGKEPGFANGPPVVGQLSQSQWFGLGYNLFTADTHIGRPESLVEREIEEVNRLLDQLTRWSFAPSSPGLY